MDVPTTGGQCSGKPSRLRYNVFTKLTTKQNYGKKGELLGFVELMARKHCTRAFKGECQKIEIYEVSPSSTVAGVSLILK